MRVIGPTAMLVVAAVALAACSDDDNATTATTAAAAVQTTATETTAASTEPAASAPSTASSSTAAAAPTTTSATTTSTTSAVPVQTGNEPRVALTEIGSFQSPVHVAWRSGDDAMYVVEKGGRIQRFTGDEGATVLDVSDQVSSGGEQGLLGLAFHPTEPLAYINFTDGNGNTIIEEHAVGADGTFAVEARRLFEIEQPYANHNGGDLRFGPDGMLYIGMGDGGAGGDPERRATNLGDLLGKMLRVDPTPSEGLPYTVPADNPFIGTAGARAEIWSTGLRNPWRYSFDRLTGDLWIADVGQNAIEEVDVAPATDGRDAGKGLYFGWSAFEGNDRYNDDVSPDGATPPFWTYEHGPGCSVSGGVRARGGPVADLVGWYVYGDYCSGELWALEVLGEGSGMTAGRQVDLPAVPALSTVVDGSDGTVYAISLQGPIFRLDPA